MRCYHARTNVAGWACDDLAALDAALEDAGSVPLDLPWHEFALESDGDHFTDAGARTFAAALARAFATARAGSLADARVHVVADSTVGHRPAYADYVAAAFRARGAEATVTAVCGAGFVARADSGEHFRALRRRGGGEDAVIFVGGWNDLGSGHSVVRVCAAARAAVGARERHAA